MSKPRTILVDRDRTIWLGAIGDQSDLTEYTLSSICPSVEVLKSVAEALNKGIELLEPFQGTGFLGDRALNKHREALALLTPYLETTAENAREK